MLKIVPIKEEKNFIVMVVGRGRGARPEPNPRMPYRTIETHKIFVTIRILDYYAGQRGDFHHRLVAVARPALETRQRPGEVKYQQVATKWHQAFLFLSSEYYIIIGGV